MFALLFTACVRQHPPLVTMALTPPFRHPLASEGGIVGLLSPSSCTTTATKFLGDWIGSATVEVAMTELTGVFLFAYCGVLEGDLAESAGDVAFRAASSAVLAI